MKRKRELRARGPQPGDVVIAHEQMEGNGLRAWHWYESGKVVKPLRKTANADGQWAVRRTQGTKTAKVLVTFVAASEAATVWKEVVA
jgi:hypothetical protein